MLFHIPNNKIGSPAAQTMTQGPEVVGNCWGFAEPRFQEEPDSSKWGLNASEV